MTRAYLLLLLVIGLAISCSNNEYSPKPRGYYRIDLPKKEYILSETGCPFSFEIPTYSILLQDSLEKSAPCTKNLEFPQFNAKLHLSYFDINNINTFDQLSEDARKFAFKHTAKATGIKQKLIKKPSHDVYGIEYFIDGNTASNYQFYISDSTKNYLRGALYFKEKPNLDSIQPVLDFLENDIKHLINTFRWK